MEGEDVELDVYEAALRFIEEWLDKPMPIEAPVAFEVEKNATKEVVSAAVQAVRVQMNEKNPALFNVLTLSIWAGVDCSRKAAKATVLKLPCSIFKKKKVKMKNPAYD